MPMNAPVLSTAQKIAAYLAPILNDMDMETAQSTDIFEICCRGGFADAKRYELEEAMRIIMAAWGETVTANDK